MAQLKAVGTPAEELPDVVDELQPGTKLLLGQYTITRYLNSGGFGITYLAKDSLDRDVVIKECFPSNFCRRSKTVVVARSRAHSAELRSVVQLFVREARSLSKIVHPNIVAVHQVFEDNGTAYMAIDYVDGLDLLQIIDGHGTMPTIDEVVILTRKLLQAVGYIHSKDMLHRDISPDNVLIRRDGEPVLIDFGAAREQASQTNRALSALRVVKDGYSPQEFYIAGAEQGPWSDLYALGAALYHLISGEAPVNGQARLAALAEARPDPYVPLDGRIKGYPPRFLRAIDIAMATLPKQRMQSAAAWLSFVWPSGAGTAETPGERFNSRDLMEDTSSAGIEDAVREMINAARSTEVPAPAPQPEAAQSAGVSVAALDPEATRPAEDAEAARPAEAPVSAAQPGTAMAAAIPGATRAAEFFPDEFGEPPEFEQAMFEPEEEQPEMGAVVETRGGFGKAKLVAGIIVVLALAGGATLMIGTGEVDEPVTIGATEAEPPTTPTEPPTVAAADATPVAPVATEAAAAAPESMPEPVVEPDRESLAVAAPETVPQPEATQVAPTEEAAPAVADIKPAFPAPSGTIRPNQISFAAWGAEMPFLDDNRIIGGQRRAIIARIMPGTNLAEAGNWLAPGLLLYTVNGVDIQQSGGMAAAVLNAMTVDPDGKARVVVEYAGPNLDKQTGLLTVNATRLVSLANGVSLSVKNVDGEWQTVVTGVTVPSATQLRQGDILFRDKLTGIALDGPQSIERVMSSLVSNGVPVTEFAIIKDNKLSSAAMQLAVE